MKISVRAGHSSALSLDRYGHLYQDAEFEVPDRLVALLASRRAPDARHIRMTGSSKDCMASELPVSGGPNGI